MTLISALELFSNPYDLEFLVGENTEKKDGTFSLMLTRGPEHNFKVMLTGEGYKSKDDAIDTFKKILDICVEKGEEVFFGKKSSTDDVGSLLKAVGNPKDCKREEAKNALTKPMVEKIISSLKEAKVVSTYTGEWKKTFAA